MAFIEIKEKQVNKDAIFTVNYSCQNCSSTELVKDQGESIS